MDDEEKENFERHLRFKCLDKRTASESWEASKKYLLTKQESTMASLPKIPKFRRLTKNEIYTIYDEIFGCDNVGAVIEAYVDKAIYKTEQILAVKNSVNNCKKKV